MADDFAAGILQLASVRAERAVSPASRDTFLRVLNDQAEHAFADGIARVLSHVLRHVSDARLNDAATCIAETQQKEALISGVIALGKREDRWIRPLEDWRPSPHGEVEWLFQLARHLLVKWQMPVFMDSVWLSVPSSGPRNRHWDFEQDEKFRNWYADIGSGSPVDCPSAPMEIEARQTSFFRSRYGVASPKPHLVMQAPDHFRLPRDWKNVAGWAEIRRAGGTVEEANRLCVTRLSNYLNIMGDLTHRRPLWFSFTQFLLKHPDFPFEQIDPVLDYLYEIARRSKTFSMRGRTPRSLLRDMERWHDERTAAARRDAEQRYAAKTEPFPLSGRRPMRMGKSQMDLFRPAPCWIIEELGCFNDLLNEAEAMRNCVTTYVDRCSSGEISIWSLKRAGFRQAPKHRLTVEVMSDGRIMQARGPRNRWPRWDEWAVLEAWARREGLKFDRWCTRGPDLPTR